MGDPNLDVVPNVPLSKDYSIHAVPDVTSVTPGAKITYVCLFHDGVQYPTAWSADYQGLRDHFSWYLIPESAIIRSKSSGELQLGVTLSAAGPRWLKTWDEDPGKYVVVCAVNRYSDDEKWCFLGQRVTPLDAVMSRMWCEGSKEAPKQADQAVEFWQGQIKLVKQSQEKFPGSIDFSNLDKAAASVPPGSVYASQIQAYKMCVRDGDNAEAARIAQNANENFRKERQDHANQTIHELEKYRDKLAEILQPTDGKMRFPVRALHYATEVQSPTWLNVFVCKMSSTPATPETKRYSTFGGRPHYETVPAQPPKQTWRLVDWSFPTLDLPQQFDQTGVTDDEALDNLFDAWNHYKNKYPPGKLQYHLILPQTRKANAFDTDGATRWDYVVKWLGIGATAALMVMGVGFVCGPAVVMFGVTGEAVASTGMWVMIFSSTAAATINIAQRQILGIGSWKDNVFDGLTIVGNMLAGIGAVSARVAQVAEEAAANAPWARAAYLEVSDTSGKVLKGCLIGQIGDNMIQGVLVAEDYMKEYETLISDPNIPPEERAARFVNWSRNLAFSSLMTFISLKSTATDIEALNLKAQIAEQGAKFSEDPNIVKTPNEKLDMLADPKGRFQITTKPVTEGEVCEADPNVKRRVTTHTTTAEIQGRAGELSGPSEATPPPNARGLTTGQDEIFSTMAQDKQQIILVRDANPAAVNYYGKPGYGPKPETLKAKTAKGGSNIGLAVLDPSDQRLVDMLMADSHLAGTTFPEKYTAYKAKLEGSGYKIGSPEEGYVVTNAEYTKGFYSDCDLHGVYNADGSEAWLSDSQAGEMNQQFGTPTIMHGPQDNWTQRTNPEMGPNAGPQGKGVTAYMPDGTTVHINSNEDLKAFYKQHNIDWDKIWQGKY